MALNAATHPVASVLVSAWRTTGLQVAAFTDRSRGSDLVEASVITFAKYAKSAGAGLAAGLGHTQRACDTGTCGWLARSILLTRGQSRRRPPRRGLMLGPSAKILADVWTQWTWSIETAHGKGARERRKGTPQNPCLLSGSRERR